VAVVFAVGAAAAEPNRPLMREFIGLNGHTVQFKPDLYQPVARLVRDYHPVEWDLGTNTSEAAPFPFAKNRVDWSRVYGSWTAKEWNVDVCLMFDHIIPEKWRNLEADARAYGKAFAREFGPSGKRKLVESVEIGNEPGNWSDPDYTRIYQAMAEGVREGDPKLKLATCNLSAGKSGKYDKSVECVAKLPDLVDVLNVHTYAMLENWPTWRRSFPEDPRLPKYLKDVEDLCRWRDAHAAGKPIWVTEFGYDSSTKTADKKSSDSKWVGVTDEQQAQWLVRSLLVFSAMPVERAYIYFFNDNDKPSFHASSGITRNFQPKPSFHALAQLQRALGDYRFENIVTNEPGHLRIQQYRHGASPANSMWVVWAPSGTDQSFALKLKNFPGKLVKLEAMTTRPESDSQSSPKIPKNALSSYDIKVTESPLYMFFEN
jgi:hypothetical protein